MPQTTNILLSLRNVFTLVPVNEYMFRRLMPFLNNEISF